MSDKALVFGGDDGVGVIALKGKTNAFTNVTYPARVCIFNLKDGVNENAIYFDIDEIRQIYSLIVECAGVDN